MFFCIPRLFLSVYCDFKVAAKQFMNDWKMNFEIKSYNADVMEINNSIKDGYKYIF